MKENEWHWRGEQRNRREEQSDRCFDPDCCLQWQEERSCPLRASNESQQALVEEQQEWDMMSRAVTDRSIHLEQEM